MLSIFFVSVMFFVVDLLKHGRYDILPLYTVCGTDSHLSLRFGLYLEHFVQSNIGRIARRDTDRSLTTCNGRALNLLKANANPSPVVNNLQM